MAPSFEPLGSGDDRTGFSCGVPALDRWFRMHAGQDERRNMARVFVSADDLGIVGFYTLSMFSLSIGEVPADVARKLPKYPEVPAALIGRLARAERVRGSGVGEILVADAIRRIVGATRTIAAFAIVVDAKDERAGAFYRRLGFTPFPTRTGRLFLLTDTAAAAVRRAS